MNRANATGVAEKATPPRTYSRFWSRATPYIYVSPIVLIVGVGVLFGFAYLIYLSTQSYVLVRPNDINFIGLENYINVLQDNEFWKSLSISLIWVAGSVIPQFFLGLILALILNLKFPGRSIFRSITIMPWAISGVITGTLWLWLFDGTIGVFNDLVMKAGLAESPIPWMINSQGAFFMLFVANAWRGTPFFAIMFLAALQSISEELYEAAKIDGAGAWQQFRYVTLPLIRPTIVISTMLRVIWTFNYIDLILTMTNGGPVGSTRTLAIHIYDTAFIDTNFGEAATMSVITIFIMMVFSLLYWQLYKVEND